LEGNGSIGHYPGGYTDYIEMHQSEEKERLEMDKSNQQSRKNPSPEHDPQSVSQNSKKSTKLKFSFKEQHEFETIDDDIAALEQQLSELEALISKESTNFEYLQELLGKKQVIEDELTHKMDRWVYLNDLENKINNQ
jgi:ATP-binding cassette subfamily F protein uup